VAACAIAGMKRRPVFPTRMRTAFKLLRGDPPSGCSARYGSRRVRAVEAWRRWCETFSDCRAELQARAIYDGWRPLWNPSMSRELEKLQVALRDFARERNWEQFHSPKNLASALSVEASELLEHFQWLTEEQSRSLGATRKAAVGEEMGDVLLYLLQLADKLDIDLIASAQEKLRINAVKYPVDRARGRADKYTEL